MTHLAAQAAAIEALTRAVTSLHRGCELCQKQLDGHWEAFEELQAELNKVQAGLDAVWGALKGVASREELADLQRRVRELEARIGRQSMQERLGQERLERGMG